MMNPLILVVDDDRELTDMLSELFRLEGWKTLVAHTVSDATELVHASRPDVIVLDIMLPDGNGLDVCRRWRYEGQALGIVMLSARGNSVDRILGLEIGSDDYMAKPFEPRELVARVRALLRRKEQAPISERILNFDGLTINLLNREVLMTSANLSIPVELTNAEFKMLTALAIENQRVHTRAELGKILQSSETRPLDRAVDVQITRLRRKLREAGACRDWIDTVRNVGYRFVQSGEEK